MYVTGDPRVRSEFRLEGLGQFVVYAGVYHAQRTDEFSRYMAGVLLLASGTRARP